MKKVKILIGEGLTKQESFDKSVEGGLNPKKVGRYLASFASKKDKEENKFLHITFVCILILNILMNAPYMYSLLSQIKGPVIFIPLLFLLIPIWLVYSIYKGQSIGFYIYAFFTLRGMPANFEDYDGNEIVSWVFFMLQVFLIIYSIFLKKKLFPYQNYFNTKKDDNEIPLYS